MLKVKRTLAAAVIAIAFIGTLFFAKTGSIAAPGNQTVCPVMEFEISRDLFTNYKSKRIYFCCPSCPPEFKKTPDAFMKKMQDQDVILEDIQA